jgi:mono/diheme cytochrome c family protein
MSRALVSPLLRRFTAPALAAVALVAACGNPLPAESPAATIAPLGASAADHFAKADMTRGGQLYDNWWKVPSVPGKTEPSGTNPDYAKTKGKATGSATFRCKECHAWDYTGKDGVAGLQGTHRTASPEAIYKVLREGLPDGSHKVYAALLSEADTWDLVRFIKEGIIDLTPHIALSKKEPIGADARAGAGRFSICANCHDVDGKKMNFHALPKDPEYVGTVAVENPAEFVHKVRFGQPGTKMPSAIKIGWSTKDVIDVLAHARTLPVK